MTVEELRELLTMFDQKAPVVVSIHQGGTTVYFGFAEDEVDADRIDDAHIVIIAPLELNRRR